MRVDDWESALHAALDEWGRKSFAWGTADCAMFVGACIEAQTGVHPWTHFQGKYSTQRGAAAALRKYGEGTFLKTLDALLGESVPVAFAQRGDVLMHDGNVGICMGGLGFFIGDDGLGSVKTLTCDRAWKVV